MTSRRTTLPVFAPTRTSPLPPLVAYYGCLVDEAGREDEFVTSSIMAEQVIPTLTRTPIVAVQSGDFMGDYVAMVQIPWILPDSIGDDEYTFEVDVFETSKLNPLGN